MRLILFSLALFPVLTAVAQEPPRPAGGALPSRNDVLGVVWEQPFVPDKRTTLPPAVDLSPWFPPAGDQGKQASCSGWALGYALATYHANRRSGRTGDTTFLADPHGVFSPAFVFNLTTAKERVTDCLAGVSLSDAVRLMCDTGCTTWAQYPYDTALTACQRPVPQGLIAEARANRMSHPTSIGNRDWPQWKYHLARGEPIVFLASIGPFFSEGFRTLGRAPFTWSEDFPATWKGRTGHIMVCTGYEDSTFIALNSWGTGWGERGYVRIPDSTMWWACSDAYVLDPGAAHEALGPVTDEDDVELGRDRRTRGRLDQGELHVVDSVAFRIAGHSVAEREMEVEVLDPDTRQRIHTLSVREDQPCTFYYAGDLYTFTYTGEGIVGGQLKYLLVKNDPAQQQALQNQFDVLDLQGDGVLDGQW